MSPTGVDSLDHSIQTTNGWIAGVQRELGTANRRLAYRIMRAWLHTVRDRLTVEAAARFAAHLPELLRGVFFDGWNPIRVPVPHVRGGFATSFASEADVRTADVPKAASAVTRVLRAHMSDGAVDHVLRSLPTPVRRTIEQKVPAAGMT